MGRVLSFLADAPTYQLFLVALVSRAVLFGWVVLWGMAHPDYDESALLYDVDLRLPSAAGANGTRPSPALPMLWHWDAVHYRHIADYGYTHEANYAFFPLVPLLVRGLEHLLPSAPFAAFSVLQFVLFSASAVAMRSLLRRTVDDGLDAFLSYAAAPTAAEAATRRGKTEDEARRKHRRVVLGIALFLYLASPASIFTVVSYTEPFYVALTLAGLLQLHVKGRPFVAALCLSCATVARSNGILAAPYLLLFGVSRLRRREDTSLSATLAAVHVAVVRIVAAGLVLIPYLAVNKLAFARFCNVVDEHPVSASVVAWARSVADDAASTDPTAPVLGMAMGPPSRRVVTNAAGCVEYVFDGLMSRSSASRTLDPTHTCPPNWLGMYTDIQRRHWGLGWFAYYEPRNLHNFCIAAPLFIGVAIAGRMLSRRIGWRWSRPHRWLAKLVLDSPQTCWLLAMLAIAATRMHVQVVTRFVFVCPALYLLLGAAGAASGKYWLFLITYVSFYVVLSPILFANFYPWT